MIKIPSKSNAIVADPVKPATMRLLNIHTLKLEDFTGKKIPRYAILSHRWGEDETSYKEFRAGIKKQRAGYRKIVEFCAFLRRQQCDLDFVVNWAWIDTCKKRYPIPCYGFLKLIMLSKLKAV